MGVSLPAYIEPDASKVILVLSQMLAFMGAMIGVGVLSNTIIVVTASLVQVPLSAVRAMV